MNQSFSVRQSLSLTTTVSTFPPSNFGESMPCRPSIRRLLVSCCCLFRIITIDAFRASHSLLALPHSSDHSLNIFLIIGLSPAQVVNDCNNSKEPYIYVAKHRANPRCVFVCVCSRASVCGVRVMCRCSSPFDMRRSSSCPRLSLLLPSSWTRAAPAASPALVLDSRLYCYVHRRRSSFRLR